MNKKILFGFGIALLAMTACTEDYTDWASPITVAQPQTVTFADGSVATADAIDLANVDSTAVKVCNITAPTATGYTPSYTITLKAGDNTATYDLTNDGYMQASDLEAFLVKAYGQNPIARTINAVVEMWLTNGATTVKTATSDSFAITATPDAPFIDPAGYYLVGNIDGWSCTRVDDYHMVNNGGDVYENPEFSVTFAAVEGVDPYEVKVIPSSAFNEDGTIANWGIALSAPVDVDEVAYEGHFNYKNEGGNIKFAASEGAVYYKFTVNLMEGTYRVEPVAFKPYLYFIGATDGWNASDQKLASPACDGKYTGYLYVADPNGWGIEFKFQKVAGSWADDSQLNSNNVTTVSGDFEKTSDNFKASAGEGVYYVEVDLAALTIKGTKITNMNLVGVFNEWNPADDAQQMTWDAENFCYVITNAGVTGNGWKFTANNAWDINLGGTINNLVGNGDNLAVVGTTIKLYPTRKTSNNIYCTVE